MSSIGFGTWSWGNRFLWGYIPERDDERLERTFQAAINGGLTFIDTADSYGTGPMKGRSETLLGRFIEKLSPAKSKTLTVATKLAPYPWRIGRESFKNVFLSSQKRLLGKLDRIQIHWSTSRYAPWQEIQLIDGLADLIEQGLTREIGVSNMGPKRLIYFQKRLAEREIKLKSLQIQLSLLSPKPKEYIEMRNVCNDLNIEILAYSPLAFGLLGISPEKEKLPNEFIRRQIFLNLLKPSKNLRQKLFEISIYRRVSQSQVALNWCRSKGAIPIPGLRDPNHAKDAANAKTWALSEEEIYDLDQLSLSCLKRMPNNPFQSK